MVLVLSNAARPSTDRLVLTYHFTGGQYTPSHAGLGLEGALLTDIFCDFVQKSEIVGNDNDTSSESVNLLDIALVVASHNERRVKTSVHEFVEFTLKEYLRSKRKIHEIA